MIIDNEELREAAGDSRLNGKQDVHLPEGLQVENLFGQRIAIEDEAELRQIISSLREPHDQAVGWLVENYRRGFLNGMVARLVDLGYAFDALGVIDRFVEETRNLPVKDGTIYQSDLGGYRRQPEWKRQIRAKYGRRPGLPAVNFHRFGTEGHNAITPIMVNRGHLRLEEADKMDTADSPPSNLTEGTQLQFQGSVLDVLSPPLVAQRLGGGFVDERYVNRIFECSKKIREAMEEMGSAENDGERKVGLFGQLSQVRPLVSELGDLLAAILGKGVYKVCRHEGIAYGPVATNALLSWAEAIRHVYETNTCAILRESVVLDRLSSLSSGREDITVLNSLDGADPREKDLRRLAGMINGGRLSSGQLAWRIIEEMGRVPSLGFIDLKFGEGDGGMFSPLSKEEVVNGPRPRHRRQAARYLSLADLGIYMERVARGENRPESIWPKDSVFKNVKIIYYLSASEPIEHIVAPSALERENFFRRNVSGRMSMAQRSIEMRNLDEWVNRRMAGLAANGDTTYAHQIPLPHFFSVPRNVYERIFSEVVREERPYLDPDTKFYEISYGGRGKRTLLLHLDRLIESGWIPPGIDLSGRGRLVPCALPDHRGHDKHPSKQLRADGWYCYRCKKGGQYAAEAIPERLRSVVTPFNELKGVMGTWEDGEDSWPDEATLYRHDKVMRLAQGILQAEFLTAEPARAYLRKRCLDPDLAASYGIGFGTPVLIHGLLDQELSVADLEHHGLLLYTLAKDRSSYETSLAPLLQSRGIKKKDIIRKAKLSDRGEEAVYYPRFPFLGMVTAPLSLYDQENGLWVISSMYGRSIVGKSHYKISREHTHVPAGGFNVQRALESDYDFTIVTEAVMDALSLLQEGFGPVLALGSTGNSRVERLIAQSQKDVLLGLDSDEAGCEQALSLLASLKRKGFTGNWQNFTETLFLPYAKAGRLFKDFNEYLVAKTRGSLKPELTVRNWVWNWGVSPNSWGIPPKL